MDLCDDLISFQTQSPDGGWSEPCECSRYDAIRQIVRGSNGIFLSALTSLSPELRGENEQGKRTTFSTETLGLGQVFAHPSRFHLFPMRDANSRELVGYCDGISPLLMYSFLGDDSQLTNSKSELADGIHAVYAKYPTLSLSEHFHGYGALEAVLHKGDLDTFCEAVVARAFSPQIPRPHYRSFELFIHHPELPIPKRHGDIDKVQCQQLIQNGEYLGFSTWLESDVFSVDIDADTWTQIPPYYDHLHPSNPFWFLFRRPRKVDPQLDLDFHQRIQPSATCHLYCSC